MRTVLHRFGTPKTTRGRPLSGPQTVVVRVPTPAQRAGQTEGSPDRVRRSRTRSCRELGLPAGPVPTRRQELVWEVPTLPGSRSRTSMPPAPSCWSPATAARGGRQPHLAASRSGPRGSCPRRRFVSSFSPCPLPSCARVRPPRAPFLLSVAVLPARPSRARCACVALVSLGVRALGGGAWQGPLGS